jgi:ABC-2 type transport system ATP-binding protein
MVIKAHKLGKRYLDVDALHDVSFQVGEGEIFGVVGPNGAGKTTLLKILCGLINPSRGWVSIDGTDRKSAKLMIGFLPEDIPLYEELTPESYLLFFSELYGIKKEVARERISSLLGALQVDGANRKRKLGVLSKGTKRKVLLARSLINDPKILIYDEPTSGLDPPTSRFILDFIKRMREKGKTVVISAHNLSFLERICDRILVLNKGKSVALGSLDELRKNFGWERYHLIYKDLEGKENERIAENFESMEKLKRDIEDQGCRLIDIRKEEPSLEDLFSEILRFKGRR